MKTCIDPHQSDPLPLKQEFPWRSMWRIFFLGAGVTTAIWFIQFERGRTAEYNSMEVKLAESQARTFVVENQLRLAAKGGDCGILLFNISPDLGYSQLRLVPDGRGM